MVFIWVRKLDSNSFTKMKNWSGRNEVTETSGRLHPLRLQIKWLHTPWTTDYRLTRQDRWIQMELAPTYAKSATKPNSFEIYHYRPQGRRTIGRPKKRWREQLQLWRRNGSKGPILDFFMMMMMRFMGCCLFSFWIGCRSDSVGGLRVCAII